MALTLQVVPGEFAVCRLAAGDAIPAWADSQVFSSVTRTPDELSIVCPTVQVPGGVKHEAGWRLLKLQGPFPFTETGILSSVLGPLAAEKIAILALATFDTDYVLVKGHHLNVACHALERVGHRIHRS